MSDEATSAEPHLGYYLPPVEKLLLPAPLYEEFKLNEDNRSVIESLELFLGPLDAYCIECRNNSIFWILRPPGQTPSGPRGVGTLIPEPGFRGSGGLPPDLLRDRDITLTLACTRNKDHLIQFWFKVLNRTLIKVGQYPSRADFHLVGIGKYRTILGKEQYKEFAKAIGLSAHGIGIGAFVYLRRIFERLIDEAHAKAAAEGSWNEEGFARSRMDEKIGLLRDQLPAFLVENKSLYSILSKGIHSLTEQECSEYFETVQVGIELILDERIEQEERSKKQSAAQAAISKIRDKLK